MTAANLTKNARILRAVNAGTVVASTSNEETNAATADTRRTWTRKRPAHIARPATPEEIREAEAMGQMRLPGVFHDKDEEGKSA